jgi:hypothetical protein
MTPRASLWFVFALGFGCSVALAAIGAVFFQIVVGL